MAKRRVSPNRMELMRMNNELRTARRGHRLLKDKRDGLMQQFLELLDETVAKRREVDQLLQKGADAMAMAAAVIEPEVLLEAMQMSTEAIKIKAGTRFVMSVKVPDFRLENAATGSAADLPGLEATDIADGETAAHAPKCRRNAAIEAYGLVNTSAEVDIAFEGLAAAVEPLLQLAGLEKTLQILAKELEATRRRVNSLEHVMIPELEMAIREIRMKMDENERDNLTRLMKVKDMIVKQELEARRQKSQV